MFFFWVRFQFRIDFYCFFMWIFFVCRFFVSEISNRMSRITRTMERHRMTFPSEYFQSAGMSMVQWLQQIIYQVFFYSKCNSSSAFILIHKRFHSISNKQIAANFFCSNCMNMSNASAAFTAQLNKESDYEINLSHWTRFIP